MCHWRGGSPMSECKNCTFGASGRTKCLITFNFTHPRLNGRGDVIDGVSLNACLGSKCRCKSPILYFVQYCQKFYYFVRLAAQKMMWPLPFSFCPSVISSNYKYKHGYWHVLIWPFFTYLLC